VNDKGLRTVATNAHVILKSAQVAVRHLAIDAERLFTAVVIGFSVTRDLAWLYIDDPHWEHALQGLTTGTKPVELKNVKEHYVAHSLLFGDSDMARAGMRVAAIGYPLGHPERKVSTGTLSGRRLENNKTYLQFDASLNPGKTVDEPMEKKNAHAFFFSQAIREDPWSRPKAW